MSPRAGGSIASRLARAQLAAAVATAALAALAGAGAGVATAVAREDATSLAVGRVVRDEIAEHVGDAPAGLDHAVRDEIGEQRGFGRQIEVWRGGEHVGDDGRASSFVLGPAHRAADRCGNERRGGHWWRVCAVDAPGHDVVVVGARIEPLGATLLAIVGSVFAAAVLSIAGFAWAGRRVVRRSLAPLAGLRDAVAALEGADPSARLGGGDAQRWRADEIDELAATFDALLARIEAALERERRFLFDASHELRTPLTRLKSQLELALAEAPSGAPAVGLARLHRALAACEGLVRVTESVLALARSELPPGEPVNVADVARGYIAALDPEPAARVALAAPDEALVRASPELLGMALGNLIDNALKFSGGAVRVEVRARTDEGGEAIECTVQDKGPGIADAELARVFEPFFRGRAARSGAQGAGLGLALVRHVVTAYGGTVALEHAAGGTGLRASIRLPAWRAG